MLLPAIALLAGFALAGASSARADALRRPEVAGTSASPFAPGEQIDLSIEYLHVHTGDAKLIVGRPEGAIWPIICQGRTDGLADLLKIREHYVSYWDAEARRTRGSDLTALEVGDRHTDRARFDRESGKVRLAVTRKGTTRESTRDVPADVHDLAGALLQLRLQPLAPGEHVEFPVLSGSTLFTLVADVEGPENVETPAGRFDTVRVRVRLGFTDGFATRRDAVAWFTRDARHIPVRASADFSIGTVTATIVGYQPGSLPARTAAR